jgi:membrane protease YdiL (CAAX protease family)
MADFELPPMRPNEEKISFEVPPVSEPPKLARMAPIWIVLFALFGFIIFGQLSTKSKESKATNFQNRESVKQKMIEIKLGASGMQRTTPGRADANLFLQEIEELSDDAKTKPEAQRLRVVLRYEDRKKPFADDLKKLVASKSSSDRAFANLYLAERLEKASAETFLTQLDKKDFASKIATVQIREKFGDLEIRTKTFDPTGVVLFGAFGFLGCLGLILGMGAWMFYLSNRTSDKWRPLGMPLKHISLAEADRLAAFVVIVIAGFVLGGLIKLPGAAYILVFALIVAILKLKPLGMDVSPQRLGLTLKPFAPKAGWGVGAYFANLPILIMVAIILTTFLSSTGASHPASEELLKNPNPQKILLILFLGSVVAPLWEEIVFRGFLFPAISKLTGQPVIGAVVSSFLFAAIHPQGVFGIPLLMTIGCMLCAVSYQTKSLIPAMILHAINNFVTLLLVLLLGKMFG